MTIAPEDRRIQTAVRDLAHKHIGEQVLVAFLGAHGEVLKEMSLGEYTREEIRAHRARLIEQRVLHAVVHLNEVWSEMLNMEVSIVEAYYGGKGYTLHALASWTPEPEPRHQWLAFPMSAMSHWIQEWEE